MIPTLPLGLRDRLAAAILDALRDADARRRLAAIAASPRPWLQPEESALADGVAARARRASEALAGRPLREWGRGLEEALAAAADLFEAGLAFEVHEVLEHHWARATGGTREALRGLIQTAVAFQHLANGNRAGARSLLQGAATRLSGRSLLGVELEPVARQVAAALGAVEAGRAPAVPSFPRPR